MYDLKTGAIEEFQIRLKDIGNDVSDQKAFETIERIVDENIPIYTTDLLDVAKSELRLACSYPDSLSGSGNTPPDRLIAYNIYEYLYDELYQQYSNYSS